MRETTNQTVEEVEEEQDENEFKDINDETEDTSVICKEFTNVNNNNFIQLQSHTYSSVRRILVRLGFHLSK